MPLTDVGRKIVSTVVNNFISSWTFTLRQPLLSEHHDPDIIDELVALRILRTEDRKHYLPGVLAFHFCSDDQFESFARRSVQALARVMKKQIIEDKASLKFDNLQYEVKLLDPQAADERILRLGIYSAALMGLFSGWSGGGWSNIDIVPTQINEQVVKIKDFDNLWDKYIEDNDPWIKLDSLETPPTASLSPPSPSRKVFVVHGHDEAIKQSVARFLGKLNLTPIILHEQPSKGRTVIEKFEVNSDVGFAVVLLTPDDLGASVKDPKLLKKRARQNVILELGYFIGKLGRERVCALYVEGVEKPSDIDGVVYVLYEQRGGWQFELAKEIKAAGIEVDLNRI